MAPPTRSQSKLHNFVLPPDLKWFTKSLQGTNNSPQRRPWRASSSRRRPPWADDDDVPAAAAAEQPSPPKESPIIATGISGNIPNPSPGGSSSSSRRASSRTSGEPTAKSGPMVFHATASAPPPQKPSNLRIKFTSSKSGTPSKSGSSSSKRGSSSSGGKPPPPPVCFNVLDGELNCIDLLNSGLQLLDKDKSADSKRPVSLAPEKTMIEEFDKALSAVLMDTDQDNTHENEGRKVEKILEDIKGKKECEQKEPSLQINKGKKEEKPIRTYVRSLRKKLEEREKRLEKVMQRKVEEDEEYKPDVPTDANSDDLNAKIWNLRTRKPDRKAEVLNLDKKKLGSSSNKDEGKSVKDQKGKEVVIGGGSKRGDEKVNAEANKNKGKAKKPMQEQHQTQGVKLPKVNTQLTPEEIADDLFALGIGPRPTRRPNPRTRKVQRDIDQVTPGMSLESITMDRYKVPDETTKKGKKRQ